MDSVIESPYDGAIGPFNATHQAETSIQPMINSLNSLNSPGYPHMPHQQPRNPSSFPVANPINGFYPPRAPRRPSSRPRSRDHTPLRTGQGRSRALSDGKAPSREARWSGSSAHSPMTRSPSHASITKRHLAPLDLNFYPTPSSFTSGAPNVPRSTRHSVDPISASTMSSDNFNFLSSPDNDSAVNSAVDIQSNWSFPDVLSSASSVSNVGSVAGSGVFGYQKPWHTPQYVHSGLPAAWDEPALSQHPNQLQDSSMMFAHRVMPSRPASHNSWTFDSARSSLSYAQPAYPTIHSDLELSRIHRGSSYSLPTYGEEYPQSMPSLVPCKSETLVPQESAMLMADDPFDLPIQMPMDDMWTPANGHVNGHAGIMSQH